MYIFKLDLNLIFREINAFNKYRNQICMCLVNEYECYYKYLQNKNVNVNKNVSVNKI